MFVYCERCGMITSKKNNSGLCMACEVPLKQVPEEYLSPSGVMFISQDKRKEFEFKIQQSEEFDKKAFEERDEIIKKKNEIKKAEIDEKVAVYNENRVKLTCPICHAECLTKISNVGKFVKVSAFGILGAGDLGKTYKCGSCGYRF